MYAVNGEINIPNSKTPWKFAILRIRDKDNKYYPSSHIIANELENHVVRYNSGRNLSTIFIEQKDKKLSIRTNYQNQELSELNNCVFYYID